MMPEGYPAQYRDEDGWIVKVMPIDVDGDVIIEGEDTEIDDYAAAVCDPGNPDDCSVIDEWDTWDNSRESAQAILDTIAERCGWARVEVDDAQV